MVRTFVILIFLAGSTLTSPYVQAGEAEDVAAFERGEAAFNDGDYDTAYREWLPLAEAGNAELQLSLGFMYAKGLGVRQDDTMASVGDCILNIPTGSPPVSISGICFSTTGERA